MKMITLSVMLCVLSLVGCDKLPQLSKKQELVKDGIFVSSLETPPVGWTIQRTFGSDCQIFGYSGNSNYIDDYSAAIQELHNRAKKQGANAIINFKISGSSFEQQGSKWHTALIHLCGEPVKLN